MKKLIVILIILFFAQFGITEILLSQKSDKSSPSHIKEEGIWRGGGKFEKKDSVVVERWQLEIKLVPIIRKTGKDGVFYMNLIVRKNDNSLAGNMIEGMYMERKPNLYVLVPLRIIANDSRLLSINQHIVWTMGIINPNKAEFKYIIQKQIPVFLKRKLNTK